MKSNITDHLDKYFKKGNNMNNSDNTKNKTHPWRTYGSPISKQWDASHETAKTKSMPSKDAEKNKPD